MIYKDRCGEIEITGISDFDIEKTFECGQCFRWHADNNGTYRGVAYGRAARVRQAGDSIYISGTLDDFETVWRDYFDLERDYAEIRKNLAIDDFIRKAIAYSAGLRILRQDAWEALCSFIISQCNNIPRIKKIINTLCREFGSVLDFEGEKYYTFPSAERLAVLNESDLAVLRCGYRASYIIGAARAAADGILDFRVLAGRPPEETRAALKKLHGVGDKVADCFMLYGLNMLDSFPLDVWMKRAVAQYYSRGFDPGIFSPFAGIAQQYIFHYIRHNSGAQMK